MTTPSITLYGIKTCDTVRKARRWLDTHQAAHTFVDLREDGQLTERHLQHWLSRISATELVNKRSTTWKQLDTAQKDDVLAWMDGDTCQASLMAFLQDHPTLIKRPVFEQGDDVWVGFKADQLQARL